MTPVVRRDDPVNSDHELAEPHASRPKTQPGLRSLTGRRTLSNFISLLLVFLCFSGVRLFLGPGELRRTRLVERACPSENELRAESYFRLWDQKLEKALRLSGQGPPKMEEEAWHAVTDHIHVFSAFVATTTMHAIHITAIVRRRMRNTHHDSAPHPPLVCVIRTPNHTATHKARIRLVWTYYNPGFRNALILCPPPNETSAANGEDIRVAVAVAGAQQDSLRWLQLHQPSVGLIDKCCAVCIRPIHGPNLSLWKVVEFVAHYRSIGANSFYIYDFDAPSGLKLLLAWLQSAGVDVKLIPFKLIASSGDVHSHGQLPALYDCIFRSMSRMEYYIHVDFDELIVPVRHRSIPVMLREMERESSHRLGSLVVSNRYFCADYPLNINYSDQKYVPLQTRLFTLHNEDMTHAGLTKNIGLSRAVCEAAVHTVARLCKAYKEVLVDSTVAIMNHYRRCCSFEAEHPANTLFRLWNVSEISVDHSSSQLSAGIERDVVMRSLRRLCT
ncbi:uncharacterized protein LOC142785132 [Rhipicephalus microplus]|uniref:uncharacterized protein LOC142785132 n=1 Tax=Rhipicephalus microplus TaxID=6941 RepID=UPI003F6B08EA